jgi:hypothetical protein
VVGFTFWGRVWLAGWAFESRRVAAEQLTASYVSYLILSNPITSYPTPQRLENYLAQYKKCLVMVSHSQDFLNGAFVCEMKVCI